MHRLTRKQTAAAILSLKHLEPNEKDDRPTLTLKQLEYLTGIRRSSLSNYFQALRYVGIIEKVTCGECRAERGFAKGPKADRYLQAWGLREGDDE